MVHYFSNLRNFNQNNLKWKLTSWIIVYYFLGIYFYFVVFALPGLCWPCPWLWGLWHHLQKHYQHLYRWDLCASFCWDSYTYYPGRKGSTRQRLLLRSNQNRLHCNRNYQPTWALHLQLCPKDRNPSRSSHPSKFCNLCSIGWIVKLLKN